MGLKKQFRDIQGYTNGIWYNGILMAYNGISIGYCQSTMKWLQGDQKYLDLFWNLTHLYSPRRSTIQLLEWSWMGIPLSNWWTNSTPSTLWDHPGMPGTTKTWKQHPSSFPCKPGSSYIWGWWMSLLKAPLGEYPLLMEPGNGEIKIRSGTNKYQWISGWLLSHVKPSPWKICMSLGIIIPFLGLKNV